ncbi:MAG: hypothetical protein ACI4KB_04735 [Oscillospiraceae bacterium]
MRKDDMLRKSVKNKENLIPDGYSQRISDLLASLPDEVPDSSDSEVAVISHKSRIINIRTFVSAAAAFAVVFTAVISVSKMQGSAFDKNHDEGKMYAVTSVSTTASGEIRTETAVTSSVTDVSDDSRIPAEAEVTTVVQENRTTEAGNTATGPAVTKVPDKTALAVSGGSVPAHTDPVQPEVTNPNRFPNRPDVTGNPNNPADPGYPDHPGNPDNPADPGYPDRPGNPNNPDYPDNPGHENGNRFPFVTEPFDREDYPEPDHDRDEEWYDDHYKDNGRNEFEGYDDFSDIIDEYEKIKKETEEEIESEKEKAENIIREYEEQ